MALGGDWTSLHECNSFSFSFTARVTELMKVLDDLNAGKYERTMVKADQGKE